LVTALPNYLQAHFAGACAGADLFERSANGQRDPEVGQVLREIHSQVVEERETLRTIMLALRIDQNRVLTLAARAGERLGRLKPNGSLTKRTPLTDLVEVEALRDAVAGKIAGWDALLAVVDEYPELDRELLENLRQQGHAQHDRLRDVHAIVAARALA
jgi:hypothetical protein